MRKRESGRERMSECGLCLAMRNTHTLCDQSAEIEMAGVVCVGLQGKLPFQRPVSGVVKTQLL